MQYRQYLFFLFLPEFYFMLPVLIIVFWGIFNSFKYEKKLRLDHYFDKHIYFAIGFAPVFWMFVFTGAFFIFRYFSKSILLQDRSFLFNNLIAALEIIILVCVNMGKTTILKIETWITKINQLSSFDACYKNLRKRELLVLSLLADFLGKDLKRTKQAYFKDHKRAETNGYIVLEKILNGINHLINFIVVPVMVALFFSIWFLRVVILVPIFLLLILFPYMYLFSVKIPINLVSNYILSKSLYRLLIKVVFWITLLSIFLNWVFNYINLCIK